MKKLALAILALTFGLTSMAGGNDYKVDGKASKIKWTGEKVTGKHEGFINANGGTISIKDNAISGTVTVDMNSMTCTDLQGEYGDKLIGHLKSDDFFNTASHPTATFTFKKWKQLKDGQFEIIGDLTIKGKTNPSSFVAKIEQTDSQFKLVADVKFDRSKYDIRYGSGSFFENLGDKTIYDDVLLNLEIIANK